MTTMMTNCGRCDLGFRGDIRRNVANMMVANEMNKRICIVVQHQLDNSFCQVCT